MKGNTPFSTNSNEGTDTQANVSFADQLRAVNKKIEEEKDKAREIEFKRLAAVVEIGCNESAKKDLKKYNLRVKSVEDPIKLKLIELFSGPSYKLKVTEQVRSLMDSSEEPELEFSWE